MSTLNAQARFGFASLDLRSLALFRVILGACLTTNLFHFLVHARLWFSDSGVLPLSVVIRHVRIPPRWSVLFVHGHWLWASAVFTLGIVASTMLMLGFRTRLAAFVGWSVCVSVDARNPFLGSSGELLLRQLMLFSLFLPVHGCFSVDSAMHATKISSTEEEKNSALVSNWASFAFLVQVACVYMFSAVLKSGPTWTVEGSALYHALHIDYLARPWTRVLWPAKDALKVLTWFVLSIEWACPLLLFLPALVPNARLARWVRWIGAFSLISFHAALTVVFDLGRFPWICIAAWCALLPDTFWHKLERLWPHPVRFAHIYYDGDCGFCLRMAQLVRVFLAIPRTPLRACQNDAEVFARMKADNSWVVRDAQGVMHTQFAAWIALCRTSPVARWAVGLLSVPQVYRLGTVAYRWVAAHRGPLGRMTRFVKPYGSSPHRDLAWYESIFVGAAAAAIVAVNCTTLPHVRWRLPSSVEYPLQLLHLDQRWNMFAPDAPTTHMRLAVVGVRPSGQEIDLFRHAAPFEKSAVQDLRSTFGNVFEIKFAEHLAKPNKNTWVKHAYADYVCRLWNRKRSEAFYLQAVRLYRVHSDASIKPSGNANVRRLIEHACVR